jgi:hypothetical protein
MSYIDIASNGESMKAVAIRGKENKYSREYDDLDDLFGKWSEDEFNEINVKITKERQIDQNLWI